MQMQLLSYFIDNIEIFGSLASIFGLPVAIWQIHSAKSKIQTAERAVKQLTEINKYKKYQGIITTLEKSLNDTSSLISSWNQPGVIEKDQKNNVQSIIETVNHCIVELPDGTVNVAFSALKAVTGCFEDAIITGSVDSLRDAKGQLQTAILALVKLSEKITAEENKIIARGSQDMSHSNEQIRRIK